MKYDNIKKRFDFLFSLLFLGLTIPVWVLASLVIKISSPGPIFFAQKRVGIRGVSFCLYKFRTMHISSEYNQWSTTTTTRDPRVFPAGWILRRLKIDELPQLINILKGEMSIVGPRPTVMDDYLKMSSQQKTRNYVLPGLTGLAQINCKTFTKWPERIQYDLLYIRQKSLILDLKIIINTALLILTFRIFTESSSVEEW